MFSEITQRIFSGDVIAMPVIYFVVVEQEENCKCKDLGQRLALWGGWDVY